MMLNFSSLHKDNLVTGKEEGVSAACCPEELVVEVPATLHAPVLGLLQICVLLARKLLQC